MEAGKGLGAVALTGAGGVAVTGAGAGVAAGAGLGAGGDTTTGGAVTVKVNVVLRESPPDVAVMVIG